MTNLEGKNKRETLEELAPLEAMRLRLWEEFAVPECRPWYVDPETKRMKPRWKLQLPSLFLFGFQLYLLFGFYLLIFEGHWVNAELMDWFPGYWPINWVHGVVVGILAISCLVSVVKDWIRNLFGGVWDRITDFFTWKIPARGEGASSNEELSPPEFTRWVMLGPGIFLAIAEVVQAFFRDTTYLQRIFGPGDLSRLGGVRPVFGEVALAVALAAIVAVVVLDQWGFFLFLSIAALVGEFVLHVTLDLTISGEVFKLAAAYPGLYFWAGFATGAMVFLAMIIRRKSPWYDLALLFWLMVSAHIFWHLSAETYRELLV